MGVPADPTVSSIVTDGLRRGGRTNPTVAQVTEATNTAFQYVKSDIMQMADTHPTLLVTATTVTTRGLQRYSFPEDYNEPYSISLLDGPDEWRFTLSGATSTTVTFPSSIVVTDDEMAGKFIIVTSGPGVEEYRQIVSYNPSTRVAVLEAPWVVNPTSTSTVLIVSDHRKLYSFDTPLDFDNIPNQTSLSRPVAAAENGSEYLLYPTPDKSTYGILNRYFVDLSKMDQDTEPFTTILREWQSLFVQGVAVKTMQRYDEDRYQTELQVYNFMLTALQNKTCRVKQMLFKDI